MKFVGIYLIYISKLRWRLIYKFYNVSAILTCIFFVLFLHDCNSVFHGRGHNL